MKSNSKTLKMYLLIVSLILITAVKSFLLSTAVPIRIGSISLYFPDCLFSEDRRWEQSGVRLDINKQLRIRPIRSYLNSGN